MKFKTTDKINLRLGPSINSPSLGTVQAGTVVEGEENSWRAVTLADGTKGYCAAVYLEPTQETTSFIKGVWHTPIREDKFKVTQRFLTPDNANYPKTGCHPGVDYGTQAEDNVPLYFCADGEVIETRPFHKYFGNCFFYYVPEADRTFVYFHLRDTLPSKGFHKAGEVCGITGKTGLSYGIHLHLECLKGRKTSADRAVLFTSKENLVMYAEDADAFIRARL